MRRIAIVCLLLVAACKKEENKGSPPPAPAPTEKQEEPKPEAKPAPAPTDDGCMVKVTVTKDKVSWDGGGITGETARATADLSPLAPLAGTCSVHMDPTDDVTYADVVAVMDELGKHGLRDIGLGRDPVKPTMPPPGPRDPGLEMKIGPDGTIYGESKAPADLSKVVIVAITTKEVQVNGKAVAELADGDFSALLGAALPPDPQDPTIVIQADRSLEYRVISTAIETVDKAGYTNVLFAVKNQ
jgi:biopolymer transport protein ExbD